MSLPTLTDVSFCETSVTTIFEEILARYEGYSGRELKESDPIYLLLKAFAYQIAQERSNVDQAGKSNLLYYSTGDFLDQIGLVSSTERTAAKYASATLRFYLDEANVSDITIPSGTRATKDGSIFWLTNSDATIPAGSLYIDVIATCDTAGETYNNIAIGAINMMVDAVQYVSSVANITESSGGSDAETDGALKERIYEAPESFSVAGPTGAYEYHAKSANADIIDVSVRSPSAGVVEVRPLMSGGELPSSAVISEVEEILTDDKIRPLTDNVQVLAPEQVAYNIALTYYINQSDSSTASTIQAAVNTAVQTYISWQKAKLGRDINPSHLIYLLMTAGAKRVNLTSPNFTEVDSYQIAKEGTTSVTYGGLESV